MKASLNRRERNGFRQQADKKKDREIIQRVEPDQLSDLIEQEGIKNVRKTGKSYGEGGEYATRWG